MTNHKKRARDLGERQRAGERKTETPEPNTLVIENESLRRGFTIMPNYVLRDPSVSFGAKLTYTLLLSYAWQEGSCFPGQGRLGDNLGVTRKAINKYLRELKQSGFVSWTRRGLGKTNVYVILDYTKRVEADVTKRLHQDETVQLHPDVTHRLHKEYPARKHPKEEYSDKNVSGKRDRDRIEYYAQLLADKLHDQKSVSFYRVACQRHDPHRLLRKAQEIIADGKARKPAAVFVHWLKDKQAKHLKPQPVPIKTPA